VALDGGVDLISTDQYEDRMTGHPLFFAADLVYRRREMEVLAPSHGLQPETLRLEGVSAGAADHRKLAERGSRIGIPVAIIKKPEEKKFENSILGEPPPVFSYTTI
jgi:hypothetical protein